MKAWIWFRGLAVLLAVFATGHTLGTAAPRVTRGASEAALFDAMQSFRFPIMGFDRTYWDFYRGFAITISVLLFGLMVMAWQVGTFARRAGREALPMAVTLQSMCIALFAVGCLFFFGGPIALSAAATATSTIAVITLARTPSPE